MKIKMQDLGKSRKEIYMRYAFRSLISLLC